MKTLALFAPGCVVVLRGARDHPAGAAQQRNFIGRREQVEGLGHIASRPSVAASAASTLVQ